MTTRRTVLLSILAVILLAVAPRAGAQISGTPVLYRLESGSSFSRGCYPPCTCPLFTTNDIRGTYVLTFDHQDPLFMVYRVSNVNWVVTIDGTDTRITGSGTYKVGGEVAVQQQMVLKLAVGTAAVQTFDSGLVGGGQSFPDINITISVNGMVCFDTVIGVRSRPVPATDITRYALNHSTYEEGCFPPCTCPLQEWPVGGTFDLVPLPNATTPIRREWAVVNVNWSTISITPPPPPPARHFIGFGTYQIVNVGPTNNNRMTLDLTETNSGKTARFDSGSVSGGSQFPNIDINLSVNGFYCLDQAFFLHAAPQ
jgi:hypothetical protein